MRRAARPSIVGLISLTLLTPTAAQGQFSRERFLTAVAMPLTTLANSARADRDGFGRVISAPKVYVDQDLLAQAPWSDLVEIPQLVILTGGKRAGFMLGLAYLATQELGIPIRTENMGPYTNLTAAGVFGATIFNNNIPRRVSLSFQNHGDFQNAAISLLQKAVSGDCEFSRGWSGNDARELDFLKRTCREFHSRIRENAPQGAITLTAAAGDMMRPGGVTTGAADVKPAMTPEARAEEIKRRSNMSLSELKTRTTQLSAEEYSLTRALSQNAANTVETTNVKAKRDYTTKLAADLNEERQRIEARLVEVRADEELQTAALRIVEAREQEAAEKNLRLQAEEAARTKLARDAQRDKFEASPRGVLLNNVIRASLFQVFLQNNPSPLPSERARGESAVRARAKCMVRYITPKDPDHMTDDESAAIQMIITDLPLHGKIGNKAVAFTYELMNAQCMNEGQ